jgi:hypothetical protein
MALERLSDQERQMILFLLSRKALAMGPKEYEEFERYQALIRKLEGADAVVWVARPGSG